VDWLILTICPPHSFARGACAAAQVGNAVNIDVIDLLLRPTVLQLWERSRRKAAAVGGAVAEARAQYGSRRWVMLSLFNGVDGFLLGFERCACACSTGAGGVTPPSVNTPHSICCGVCD
jgi:hypothetical protein